ncbi:MAG TPA: hypothetical protein VMR54_11105 [Thermoanaerobaculia bacterium]|nr:hypothetical protein [Thermoanaerobaculia bacterium]
MHFGESVKPPSSGRHNKTCPFCEGDEPELLGYKTKKGDLKDERVLGRNLATNEVVSSDGAVGPVYPLDGGDQPHNGWEVEPGYINEIDIPVIIKPTPHHLIPGNAAMAESHLEVWTCKSFGEIKEDIGYNIDCAQNGIWLPHLPHVYWTSFRNKRTRQRFCDYYDRWSDLSDDEQMQVGVFVMSELKLQMHYTDHDDPYAHVDDDTTYDGEAKERCNLLADLILEFWADKCPESSDKEEPYYYPPYGLVERINLQSDYMRKRITGNPRLWKSWVSPLAQEVSAELKRKKKVKANPRGAIKRIQV